MVKFRLVENIAIVTPAIAMEKTETFGRTYHNGGREMRWESWSQHCMKPIWTCRNKHVNMAGVHSILWCGEANQNQPVKYGWSVRILRKCLS